MADEHEGALTQERPDGAARVLVDGWLVKAESVRAAIAAIAAFAVILDGVLRPAVEKLVAVLKALDDAMYDDYVRAGAPYGRRRRGMRRWLRENLEEISSDIHVAVDEVVEVD